MRHAAAALVFLGVFALSSCAGPGGPDRELGTPEGPPPTIAELREAQNARVERLDRLWSRMVVRLDFVDQEGRSRSEQVEGHLQYIAPRRLLMTFTKLGELYFIIGSNEDLYWWIQLGEDKRASVGRYDAAPERPRADVDLPVHPLDVIELLAVQPLPESGASEPVWAPNGSVRLDAPARWGTRRIYFHPETLEPVRVEMYGEDGVLAAASDLTRYEPVALDYGAAGPAPRVPTRFWIRAPEAEATITVDLYGAEVSEDRPREVAFDFEHLIEAYRVDRVQWIRATDLSSVGGVRLRH